MEYEGQVSPRIGKGARGSQMRGKCVKNASFEENGENFSNKKFVFYIR